MLRSSSTQRTIVIGAGIGGLASAARLAHGGQDVIVLERADGPGGKLRTIDSVAGPVDAGPTVFTMRPLFEALFQAMDERLEDHLDLAAEPVLARHWWPDGSTLDLHADAADSLQAISAFAGPDEAGRFQRFCADAQRLFEAFDGPIMQSDRPHLAHVAARCLASPKLMAQMTPPRTLWSSVARSFNDPRLQQLFARYATYVGGSPYASPGLLMLIWHAEASGVWRIKDGMKHLAHVLETLAFSRGARFEYGAHVAALTPVPGRGIRVRLESGEELLGDSVVFNGDPAALADGHLGPAVTRAVAASATTPRALSAYVWTFAAEPSGVELAHHNVFFNQHYRREFAAIDKGKMPSDATLYICAQDRGHGLTPTGPERFEIIMNGPPVTADAQPGEDFEQCRNQTFEALARMGLHFNPWPGREALTTPHDFARLFPGSAGSLYGRSPHGMMATFKRPTVRSAIPGLYLAGGGVHPGAGLPMAMSSGRHAAEAILKDRASISTSRRTVMPGGMSTDFQTTASTASRSSLS